MERVRAGVDPAEAERVERERTARVNAERREVLYGRLFRNVTSVETWHVFAPKIRRAKCFVVP